MRDVALKIAKDAVSARKDLKVLMVLGYVINDLLYLLSSMVHLINLQSERKRFSSCVFKPKIANGEKLKFEIPVAGLPYLLQHPGQ